MWPDGPPGQLYLPPVTGIGIGQSSSVMLLQKIQTITTDSSVKNVSNNAPLIFPSVPWQMWVLMTKVKIWPIAKSRAAAVRYTIYNTC